MILVERWWWNSRRASATHACARGGLDASLVPVLRSLDPAEQAALFPLEFLLGPAQEARGVDLRAVGQNREVSQAQIARPGPVQRGERPVRSLDEGAAADLDVSQAGAGAARRLRR